MSSCLDSCSHPTVLTWPVVACRLLLHSVNLVLPKQRNRVPHQCSPTTQHGCPMSTKRHTPALLTQTELGPERCLWYITAAGTQGKGITRLSYTERKPDCSAKHMRTPNSQRPHSHTFFSTPQTHRCTLDERKCLPQRGGLDRPKEMSRGGSRLRAYLHRRSWVRSRAAPTPRGQPAAAPEHTRAQKHAPKTK